MKKILTAAALCALLAPALARAGEWHEKIKLGGDFRLRYEMIQDESKDADRHRLRIRARLQVGADLTDEFTAAIRLASGGDDPVSTNQTLNESFTTKPFGLDLAYLKYAPKAVEGLSLAGGKIAQPFVTVQKTELVWDGDLNPEGVALQFARGLGESVDLFLNGAWFSVVERSSSDDTWMAGGQAGFKVKPSGRLHMTAGGSYYSYENLKGIGPLYDDDFWGNTSMEVDSVAVFANEYRIVEVFGEIGMKFEKVDAAVYGSYVNNTGADSLNAGYLFGAAVRYGKGKGSFSFYGNYRELEDDAVVGAFNDSDFVGGGTDCKGFELGASYGLADKISLDGTYFMNDQGIEEEVGFDRLQLDIQVKF